LLLGALHASQGGAVTDRRSAAAEPERWRRRVIAAGLAMVAILAVVIVLWVSAGPGTGGATVATGQPSSEASGASPGVSPTLGPALAPAPAAQSGSQDPEGPRVIARARWGGGAGELGISQPSQGNPEAPMSFAPRRRGGLLVLDHVNGRLVTFDAAGRHERSTSLASRYPQDVAEGTDGTVAVLDRLGDRSVTLLDESGRSRGAIPLSAEGMPPPGGVTGVFVDGKDVYVEREHATLVKIGTTDGKAATSRDELPGRPSRDGKLLLAAGLIDPAAGRVWVSVTERAGLRHRFTRELRLAGQALELMLLDSDAASIIYVAASVARGAGSASAVQLACLEPMHGAPIGGAQMAANDSPHETFRELVVLDAGGVVYARRTEQGVSYEVYECR
jgi:hypothetical protein